MAQEESYDWNDTIESDGTEYVTLEEGEYPFSVVGFSQGFYNGGGKTPPSPQANLELRVGSGANTTTIRDQIILHPNFDWKIAGFFRSIGAKKRGEKFKMKWDRDYLIGKTGRVTVTKDPGKKNPDIFFNNVKRYEDPAESTNVQDEGEEEW